MYMGLRAKYQLFLSGVDKLWPAWTDSCKTLKY